MGVVAAVTMAEAKDLGAGHRVCILMYCPEYSNYV